MNLTQFFIIRKMYDANHVFVLYLTKNVYITGKLDSKYLIVHA